MKGIDHARLQFDRSVSGSLIRLPLPSDSHSLTPSLLCSIRIRRSIQTPLHSPLASHQSSEHTHTQHTPSALAPLLPSHITHYTMGGHDDPMAIRKNLYVEGHTHTHIYTLESRQGIHIHTTPNIIRTLPHRSPVSHTPRAPPLFLVLSPCLPPCCSIPTPQVLPTTAIRCSSASGRTFVARQSCHSSSVHSWCRRHSISLPLRVMRHRPIIPQSSMRDTSHRPRELQTHSSKNT